MIDEVDFLHSDKHESFLQIDTMIDTNAWYNDWYKLIQMLFIENCDVDKGKNNE